MGRRLPGPVELHRLPLRTGADAVRHRLPETSTRPSPSLPRRARTRRLVSTTTTVNPLLAQDIPMVPITYGGSAVAYRAGRTDAHASPLTNENLSRDGMEGQPITFVLVQNGEPSGLYCPTRPTARRCESVSRSASRCWPTRSAARSRSRHWRRVGSPTKTSRCGRSTSVRADVPRRLRFDPIDVVESYRSSGMPPTRGTSAAAALRVLGCLFEGSSNPPPAEE